MKVLRLPAVDAEALEAARYDAAIDHKLGLRLGEEFEATVERILRFPLVVAFANTHRRPNDWRSCLVPAQ